MLGIMPQIFYVADQVSLQNPKERQIFPDPSIGQTGQIIGGRAVVRLHGCQVDDTRQHVGYM